MATYAIRTRGLVRRFGALTAVAGIDLEVPVGAVYGFLGPNAAGKTTTIRMLLGLIRPNAGEVGLFGQSLKENPRAALSRVGALVETPSIYPHLTGWENLEVTRRLIGATRARAERAMAIVGLEQAGGRRAGDYSLGMRQRLGLALALLNHTELLVLDEPTNGLDPAGIHEIRELLRRLPQEYGVTVFLSSHLLGEVEQVATHIGIIHEGRMLFQGELADLQAQLREQLVLGVAQRARAEELLGRAGWHVLPSSNGHITVAVNGQADAALINQQLVGAGVAVHHLSVEQPSLEEVFLEVTKAGARKSQNAAQVAEDSRREQVLPSLGTSENADLRR